MLKTALDKPTPIRAVPSLVDTDLVAANLSKNVRAFDRDFPFYRCCGRHRRLLNQRRLRWGGQS